jgi:DNA-binding CsgD family transcriptional regulator
MAGAGGSGGAPAGPGAGTPAPGAGSGAAADAAAGVACGGGAGGAGAGSAAGGTAGVGVAASGVVGGSDAGSGVASVGGSPTGAGAGAGGAAAEDRTGPEKAGVEKAGVEKAGAEKAGAEKAGAEKAGVEKAGAGRPGAGRPGAGRPGVEGMGVAGAGAAAGPGGAPRGAGAAGGRDKRRLAALGVPADDEFLYRTLLARPRATVAELAAATGWDTARVRRRTRSLEKRGLLTRAPSRPVRFSPAPPDVAIEVLALQRQEEIERARLVAAALGDEFRSARRSAEGGPALRLLSDRDAIAQRFFQLQRSAHDEMLVLDRPPYAVQPAPRQTAVQRELLKRGVRHRTIYDHRSLESPEQLAQCRELAGLGEESRVLADVPLKLVIADRRAALVPVAQSAEGEVREVMEVHASPLLDGVLALYELLWQRSVPLWPGAGGGERELSYEDERLLALSASGLTDQAIARRLGVAQRTVERRMRRIMNLLGARTRFQAGLQAANLGVVMEPEERRHPW